MESSSTNWERSGEKPRNYPIIGSSYRHYKGGTYEVLGMALDENDEPVVVYRSVQFGTMRTRRLDGTSQAWNTRPEKNQSVDRFKLIEGHPLLGD